MPISARRSSRHGRQSSESTRWRPRTSTDSQCCGEAPSLSQLVERNDEDIQALLPLTVGQQTQCAMMSSMEHATMVAMFIFHLLAPIQEQHLRKAWNALQQRHAVLRTMFLVLPSGYKTSRRAPSQVVLRSEHTNELLVHVDPKRSAMNAASVLLSLKVQQHSALTRPMAHATVIHASDASVLAFTLHRCMFDDWSFLLLLNDFAALAADKEPSSLPGVERVLEHAGAARNLKRVAQHWRTYDTRKPTVCLLPPMSPSMPHMFFGRMRYERTCVEVAGPSVDLDRLRALASGARVCVSDLFVTVWVHLLHLLAHVEAPVVGLMHFGRHGSLRDAAQCAVPCINVLPLSISIASPAPLTCERALRIARIVHNIRQARLFHEHVPLEDVHSALGMPSRPHFNTILNVLALDGQPPQAPHAMMHGILDIGSVVRLDVPLPRPWSPLNAPFFSECIPASPIVVDVELDSAAGVALRLSAHSSAVSTDRARAMLNTYVAFLNTAFS